ncbi:MAG: SDR family oxidoreductase [Pseudomonadota bacterium]
MTDLTGHSAFITGASRGIGAATADVLAGLGAAVTLAARSRDASEAVAAAIRERGGDALALACDVADPAAVSRAVEAAGAAFGPVSILVNNAGVIEPVAPIAESDVATWSQAVDINFKGVFYGIHAALPGMLAAGSGTVITVGSGAAHSPLEGWSHYCSTKAAAHMLTRCLHREHGEQGIRVFSLSPGTVATQMQREIKASGINPVSQLDWDVHIPPEWPARAIAWMCGPDANDLLGEEVSLRDDTIRRRVGLTG